LVRHATTPPLMDLVRRLLFWAGLPLALPQGLLLRRRAPRFPAAAGADHGVLGDGPPLQLLALGDSVIAGVGAGVTEAALPARLAAELALRLQRRVHWRALGRVGADAAQVQHRLLPQLGTGTLDLVLLSVGINDVTTLRTRAAFRRDLLAVLAALRGHSPRCRIVLAGLPPLHGFPLLPQPLRFVFGQRARSFDRILQQVAHGRINVLHIPSPLAPDPRLFAADGYHPNAQCHAEWAARLAETCDRHWPRWRVSTEAVKAVMP
jgi:lysophospholipase L1-like esterase